MYKRQPEDELNCGSCGYNTCRDKAVAVLNGKAEISMCLPYLKEKAENFSDKIIKNTPNGIIVLNEALEVQQLNAAACAMLNLSGAQDILDVYKRQAVNSIVHSKTFDNGMICASEQSVIVSDKIYDKVKAEFAARGCYFLSKDETEKVRKTIIINGALNAKIVGQKAPTIASLAGVTVPETTKILIGEVESVDISEEFAHEKLSPVLAMYKAKSFKDALDKADRLIADGGFGHTAALYVNPVTEREKIDEFGARMKTCRILVNTPSSQGGIGDLYNLDVYKRQRRARGPQRRVHHRFGQ